MIRRTVPRSPWLLPCLALVLGALILLLPREASAHPLGNFTINHYSRLDFTEEEARVTYVLDLAEVPTLQQKGRLDADGDGELSDEESAAYLDGELDALAKGLRLEVGDEVLPLRVLDRSAAYRPGQGGLPILRIEARFLAELPKDWEGAASYADDNYEDRIGWREIVVRGGPGVSVEDSTAPATGVSDELRSYPRDMLSSPLDRREATFTLAPGNGTVDTAGRAAESVGTGGNGGVTDRIAALVSADRLSAAIVAISLLAAFLWGAAHTLTPGHGKAVVAAYLVGARGTARHAGLLGLTVTLTHTAGVFALGAVTLFLSRYVLPEILYPWLNVASGLLVVAIGLSLLCRRLGRGKHAHHGHEHPHHGHEHSHPPPGADGSKATTTWRSLVALGVSGGLVPCPAALVLLLGAISLGRLGFGVVLVVAFSAGLAIVLTAIGLLMIYARRLFERYSFEARMPRLVPVVSALAVSIAGLAITLGSLGQTGIF